MFPSVPGAGDPWLIKTSILGLPWQSSGWESALQMQGAWVRSLDGELGSLMPHGAAKEKDFILAPRSSWSRERSPLQIYLPVVIVLVSGCQG